VFCVAYKRRYLDEGKVWKFQYVIDPTARKLVEQGVDPDAIEDAYTLSLDMERRVRFQAWLQTFVDMSISSTINMPAWGTAANDESMLAEYERILIQYLPKIRGITVYPDGARGGQPLSPVPYKVAAGNEGVVFEESDERCLGGVCGA
jgi:ribonucleoside-diphosphate reductase alpha chain